MTESSSLRDARVVVIGAGAIGSSLAYRLAQAGAYVTVVERGPVAGGASYGSFAWTNACGKEPREYFDLNLRGIREHEQYETELGGGWLHRDGSIVWVHKSDPGKPATGGTEAFYKAIELWRGWGHRIDRLDPEEVNREYEPELQINVDDVNEVFRTPVDGWVEVVPMCHTAVHTARIRYGASLVEGEVVALRRDGERVAGVRLADDRELSADVVVNAAGPDAARISALAEAPFPLRRAPGAMIVTQPLPTSLRHIVHPGGYHYWNPERPSLRPDGGGRVTLASPSLDRLLAAGEQVDERHPAVAQVVGDGIAALPILKWARVEAVRIGVRAISPDELPIIGFDPLVPGLYHAVMHSGITLAPLVARLVTDELAGQKVHDLEPFRLARFPDREWEDHSHVQYEFETAGSN